MGDSMSTIINATTTNGVVIQPDNSGSLQLQTNNGTTAVTINTSQNVGIGTTSPVNITGYTIQTINNANTGGGVYLQSNGTTIGRILNTATDMFVGGTSISSALILQSGSAERMRITSGGLILFNTTSSITDSAQFQTVVSTGKFARGTKVTTNGDYAEVMYNAASGSVGSIQINSGGVAFNTSSDYRLKENIAPMTGALDKVAQLKPVTYNWKVDGSEGQGFIAHELAEVVPDCVSGEKDAVDSDGNIKPQGIDTSFLVATLTAAIQEQQTIINDLTARVEALEAK
jgi:hypothetical protein